MRNLIRLLLIVPILALAFPSFADSQFVKKQSRVATFDLAPKLIYNGSHKDSIVAMEFNEQGDKLLTASADGEIKLWDVNNLSLITAFTPYRHSTAMQVKWLSNDSGFIVVTSRHIKFYDTNAKEYGEIEGNYRNVVAKYNKNNNTVAYKNQEFKITNPEGRLVNSIKATASSEVRAVLLNQSDDTLIAIHSTYKNDSNGYYYYSYSLLDNSLEREIKLNNIVSQSTISILNNLVYLPGITGINTINIKTGLHKEHPIVDWNPGVQSLSIINTDKKYLAYTNKNTPSLYFTELDSTGLPVDTKAIPFNEKLFTTNAHSKLLAAASGKNLKIYKVEQLFGKTAPVTKAEKVEATPTPIVQAVPAPAPAQEPAVEPHVPSIPTQPLDISIKASAYDGVAPLKVTFTPNSDRLQDVESSLVIIDEKTQRYEGIPLQVTHTFKSAGKHMAIFAFKSKDGVIIKKEVIVDVREENFNDYKKRMGM